MSFISLRFYLLTENHIEKQKMITITLEDEKTINVPQSWNEIRLGDYEKWFRCEPQNRSDEVKLVADICGIDSNVLLEKPTQLFDTISDSLSFIFNTETYEPSNIVEIEGKNYIISFSDELTLAEWIDIETTFESEKSDRLTEILSILCRPEGEVYDHKQSEKRKDIFSNLTMDKALPLLAFFLFQNEKLETISSLYFQTQKEVKLYQQSIQDFLENGVGIKSLPIWQKIKYYCLTKYLQNRLSKYSDSYFTK